MSVQIAPGPQPVVLDTNIVLDLFVFDDPVVQPLRRALASGEFVWLATAAMRDELARVLRYPKVAPQVALRGRTAEGVLAEFDRWAHPAVPAAQAPIACTDPDDQPFIDLAVAHGATLLSKDKAVLALHRRMARLGARVDRC